MTIADGSFDPALNSSKLIDHGPNHRRYNMVVMSDGYTSAQLPAFSTDTQAMINRLFGTPPFDIMRTAINIFRADVTSVETGADIPCATPPTSARTYFDASYCLNGIERLIGVDYHTAQDVARSVVNVNQVGFVLVNHSKYGGSGKTGTAVASKNSSSLEVALHEMGHAFFDLADEYLESLPGSPHSDYWAGRDNVCRDKNPVGAPIVKWPDLVATGTAIPTTTNTGCTVAFDNVASPVAIDTVGAFEGAARFNCGVWRSQYRCIMGKDPTKPYCKVCRRKIINVLSRYAHQPQEVRRETWTLGWTTISPFVLGGEPHILSYKAVEGGVTIDRILPDLSFENKMGSTWSAGWTSLVPLATPAGQFLLLYKALTGQAEIDTISADGHDVTTKVTMTWGTGWSHIVPITLGGKPHILCYKTAEGGVTIDRLKPDGSGFENTMGSTWSTGWTTLLPLYVGTRVLLLTYKALTGEMQLSEITPDGQNVNFISETKWSPGWTGFCPFTVDGDVFYVAYQALSGLMSLDRVRPDGSGVDTILFRSWAPGWGIFVPFTVGGFPHELVYRPTDGAAAIDRIW